MADQIKEIPFSGKLMTADPATIGPNFRTLTNLRYTDTHVKSVTGMTKINSSVMDATYLKTRNAFHFKKSQPAESHVLVQAWNAALTQGVVLDNQTAIPSAGTFDATDLYTDDVDGSLGRFSDAPDGQVIYCNGINTAIWGGIESKVGAVISITTALDAAADTPASPKDYTDKANNLKTDALNVFTCGGSYKTFLIGSTRPAKGAKFYFSSANSTNNTLVVKESTAGAWNTLTVTADGTRTGGVKSFAQNGTISWASTVATTKPRYIEGYYLYWYQFTIDAGTANIYHITLDLPFQTLVDMWDGVYRDVLKFYYFTAALTDATTRVLVDDYDTLAAETYLDISSMTTDMYFEAGFAEKQTAIYFDIPAAYTNSTASTTATVEYWDGGAYASVGDINDGTATGGISFAKSGVISWYNADSNLEVKKQLGNDTPLYYYRIKFDENLDASARINYVGGISSAKELGWYKFPVFAQGRVLLCADMSNEKNKAVCSAKYMPQSYNGSDSVDIYFGEEGELTAGVELFSQFGSSLYSLILMFKDTETWVMAGQDIEQWESNTFLLSSSIGCPAPLTLKTINLQAEPGAGVNRSLAIWQSASGVFMSDGRAPIPIHGDIKEYFDKDDSRCIKKSMVGDSVGFINHEKNWYHWLFASGTAATTLNTELVYDIARNKWFEIDRTADLQCGVSVSDTDGNTYTYGFLDTGYMERLEFGTDFDGTAIAQTVQFGDMALAGLATETRVSNVRLIATAKAAGDVTCTYYPDTYTTGVDTTMSPARTGYRLAQPKYQQKHDADPFHTFKFAATISFEPIALVLSYHPTHQD